MKTKEDAERFYRDWLKILDSLAPPESLRKYLVDGTFEEWSYSGKKIANREELERYAQSTWGSIREQRNNVESLEVTEGGDGTFTVAGKILWEAVMSSDQKVSRRLLFTVKLGSGKSEFDPTGEHPKLLRYTWEAL